MTESYLFWVSVSNIISQIGFFTTFISGGVLLFLSMSSVRETFGSYKYLMMIFTSLGIVFALLEVIIHPNMHSFNSATLYFTMSKPFNLSKEILTGSLVIFTAFYSATICLIAVQFIYRYWAVFDQSKLHFFQGWYCILWAFYVLYFGAQWSIGAYNFVKTDQMAKDYFREEIFLRYNASIDELPTLALVAFDTNDGRLRWWNIMTIVNMSFIMSVQYGIMIYCGWSMKSKMEEKLKNYSITLRSHHQQLFKTLLLQIAAPTIFLFTPLSFIIYLPFLNAKLSIPTGVLLSLFSLYPAADSIIVMYVVGEYRQKLKKMASYFMKRLCLLNSNLINPYEATTTRTI